MSLFRLFGTDAANGKTPEELDAELAVVEANYRARHDADAARAAQVNAHMGQQQADTAGIDASLDDEFRAGWDEAVTTRRQQLGAAVSLPFTLIPWQLWLLAALALFVWMGGPALLRGRLAK